MVSPDTKPDEVNAVLPDPLVNTSPYILLTVFAVIDNDFGVIFANTLAGCVKV